MATRFRVYRRPIIANVDTVKNVVKATIALHNFLLITQHSQDVYNLETFLIKMVQGEGLYRDNGGKRSEQ